MLVRRIARPLFAAVFVAEGVDVLRHPETHVVRADVAYRRLRTRLDLPEMDRAQTRSVVRAHGAATAVAGLMLALGRFPRVAALTLAALSVPLVLAEKANEDPDLDRSAARRRLLERLSRVGGALLASADTAGKPGMAWRVQHARVDKAAAREARRAVAAAAKEAKATARAIRHAVD